MWRIAEERLADEADLAMPQLKQVPHCLGRASVVVNHDGRRGIAEPPLNLHGGDAGVKDEPDILAVDGSGEHDAIDAALEQLLHAVALPAGIAMGI
jgi:hypothetical protein